MLGSNSRSRAKGVRAVVKASNSHFFHKCRNKSRRKIIGEKQGAHYLDTLLIFAIISSRCDSPFIIKIVCYYPWRVSAPACLIDVIIKFTESKPPDRIRRLYKRKLETQTCTYHR